MGKKISSLKVLEGTGSTGRSGGSRRKRSPEDRIGRKFEMHWLPGRTLLAPSQAASATHQRSQQVYRGACIVVAGIIPLTSICSGGLLLKSSGRVGEAAIYGAGAWADERVAVSVSGQGELIIKSALARTIAEAIEDAGEDVDVLDILQHVLVDRFYRACIITFST